MADYPLFAPLADKDRHYLEVIAGRRRAEVKKRFLLTAVLPMAIILPMLLIVNLVVMANLDEAEVNKNIIVPEGVEHFSMLLLGIPVFLILVLVNVLMYLRSLPPLYTDLKRGLKKQIPFMPKPYAVADKFYINTGLPQLRFLEVSYEQYSQMDYTTLCYLELAPLTNIPLGIRSATDMGELPEG
jgi:hypothetical protein